VNTPQRVFVVEERDNPSAAYFVLPALAGLGLPVTRVGFAAVPDPAELEGALVVLVRYAPRPWVQALTAHGRRLAGLVFFMDDDVLDPASFSGLPWRYRFKLWRLAARRAGWLRDGGAALWVSTPALAAKYSSWKPRLILPVDLSDPPGPVRDGRQVFYHGTASHLPDSRFLVPVARDLVSGDDRVQFEIVGARPVARLFAGLPGVAVVAPMPWPAYRRFLVSGKRHVGLAPQTDTAFNHARSHTKFFDITRAGAVGVYAAGSACSTVVTHGQDGLVVPMDPAAWVDAVRALLADEPRRLAMLAAARETAARLSEIAGHELIDLFAASAEMSL
jgi:hypothetical protein